MNKETRLLASNTFLGLLRPQTYVSDLWWQVPGQKGVAVTSSLAIYLESRMSL